MKCEDCPVCDFCQAGFWYDCSVHKSQENKMKVLFGTICKDCASNTICGENMILCDFISQRIEGKINDNK